MAKKEKQKKDPMVEQIREKAHKKEKSKPTKLLPTGLTLLDCVFCGGIPLGKMINIVGDKSSSKTYLALEMLVYTILKTYKNKNIKWVYNDAEGGFSFDTISKYGIEIIPEGATPSVTIEEFAHDLRKNINELNENETLIYILDSFDGLASEAERDRDDERYDAMEKGKKFEKGTYGMERSKYMSEFFRLRAGEIKNKNVLLIIISQVRMNINAGLYGEKYTRAGGKALDFYAYICLWLYEAEKKKKKDRIIGATIKAKTKKAKVPRPYRQCFLDLLFDYGFDNISSNISFLYDLKTDSGKESSEKKKLDWNGSEYSKKELIRYIEENELQEELASRVIIKWNEIEESISSKERKSKWSN